MSVSKKLIVILIFSLVLRGAAVILLAQYTNPYYLDLAGQIGMYMVILGLCMHELGLNGQRIRAIFGRFRLEDVFVGVGMALILVLFTFGESAVSTLVVAQFDTALAYKLGSFHNGILPAHPFFSVHVFSFVVASIIFPAIIEELFFRGLLFPALALTRNLLRGAVICSIVFAILHFSKAIFVNTFIFSFVLCYLFARNKSLYACVIMHATYNLLVFVGQYYSSFHWSRSIQMIGSVSDWIPQFVMLLSSVFALAMLVRRYRILGFLRCTPGRQGLSHQGSDSL
jgi:membrane protease YdiL (CAAX protease family)